MQTRITLRGAILCSVLLCLAFVRSPQAAAQVPSFTWILSGHALEYVNALDAPITSAYFNNNQTFVATVTNVPPGWSVIRYKTFTAYGPCGDCVTSLLDAIAAGSISPSTTPILMYDIEGWTSTPANEQADPITYMQNFSNTAHQYGYKAIMAPALSLFGANGQIPCSQTTWQCYISYGIASGGALYSDYFHIQSQSQEFDNTAGVPNTNFETFVQQAHDQAKTANPNVIITAGVSTNPPAGTPSAQILYTRMTNVQPNVSGFWFNIPDAGLGACPDCGPLRPDIAIQLMEQLQGQPVLYPHAGGNMNSTSPTSNSAYSTFALTTVGASTTWVSSASYAGGITIPAGNYTFQWYTDGSSNSGTPSAGLALTVGYCSAGCPVSSQVPIISNWNQTVVGGANTGRYGGPTTQVTTTSPATLPPGGPWYLYLTVSVSTPSTSSLNLLYDSGPQGPGDKTVNYPASLAIPTPGSSSSPDFSLSATPSSQTVVQGAGTSYTATVGALSGFAGTVTLSVSGLPSGTIGTFNPTSVAGSGNSTLSVSTSSTTPAGTYTLTITGTSGSLVHSATVTLVVNPVATPDFTISATPSSQTVIQGAGTSYTTTVTALSGFTGAVTFSVTGLPTGAGGTFNPTSVNGSGTSTLSVTTSSTTPTGTYTLTITGISGSLTHSTTVTLVVNVPVTLSLVQAGALVAPGSGTISVTLPAASHAGNLLVATLTTNSPATFSGPSGWVQAAAITTSTQRAEVWYYPNNPGGVTSATFTSSGNFTRGEMTEWSGLSTSSPLDVTGSNSTASATSETVSTSAATRGSNDLAITNFAEDLGGQNTTTFTPGSGWTNLVNTGSRTVRYHATFDYKLGVSGTVSETETSGNSGAWAGLIVTFKP